MADDKTHNDQAGSQDVEMQDGATDGKKPYKMRKSKKTVERTVDEMKITELKNALRMLNLATSGNKTELQLRLRNARARQRITDKDRRAESDEESTSDEEITDEEALDDEATNDEETRNKQVQGTLGTLATNRMRRSDRGELSATEVRSQRTKQERTQPSDRVSHDDEQMLPLDEDGEHETGRFPHTAASRSRM